MSKHFFLWLAPLLLGMGTASAQTNTNRAARVDLEVEWVRSPRAVIDINAAPQRLQSVEKGKPFSTSTATNTYDGPATLEMKQKARYGFAVRPFIKVTNDVELFGRVGRSFGKSEWAFKDASTTDGGTEKANNNFYGFGIAYKLSNVASFVADYKKLSGVTDASVSMTSVGVRYNF